MDHKSLNPFQDQHPDQDQLQSYLDQTLDPMTSRLFADHLTSCSSCQAEVLKFEVLYTRLETLPEISLENDLSSVVLRAIRDEKLLSRGITWTLVIEAIGAGVVLGLMIPALRATVWIPRLMDTQLEIRAAVNIFLTQLASSWILWWAKLQVSFTQLIKPLQTSGVPLSPLPAPWVWILLAVGLGILLNGLLLKDNFSTLNSGRKR